MHRMDERKRDTYIETDEDSDSYSKRMVIVDGARWMLDVFDKSPTVICAFQLRDVKFLAILNPSLSLRCKISPQLLGNSNISDERVYILFKSEPLENCRIFAQIFVNSSNPENRQKARSFLSFNGMVFGQSAPLFPLPIPPSSYAPSSSRVCVSVAAALCV